MQPAIEFVCRSRLFFLLLSLQAVYTSHASAQRVTPLTDPTVIAALRSDLINSLEQTLADSDKSMADLAADLDSKAITKAEAAQAEKLLWRHHERYIRKTRAEEMSAKKIQSGELTMPFYYKVFGEKPESGRSLFISMHGGGGAPPRVNDSQWENQNVFTS